MQQYQTYNTNTNYVNRGDLPRDWRPVRDAVDRLEVDRDVGVDPGKRPLQLARRHTTAVDV